MNSEKANINSEITRLAWPSIVSNITTPLLGLVDTAITGHMGAAAYVGAIAVGSTMFNLAYWPLNFLRMGTSSLTSQAYGHSLKSQSSKSQTTIEANVGTALASSPPAALEPYLWLRRSLILAIEIAFVLLLLSPFLADLLLYFLNPEHTTLKLARQYFTIVIVGAPMVLGTYSLSGWFLGMQDSRAPMWMAIITNVANILMSFLLVYGFHLGIQGVAWGTVTGQALGFIVGLAIAQKKYHIFGRIRRRALGSLCATIPQRSFFNTNIDIFLRTICLAAVTLWFTRAGAAQSTAVLAANALLMQLFILFSYFMDGFAFAGEALSGKYFGAKMWIKLRATILGEFRWGLYVAGAFTLIYLFGARWIFELLSDNPSIVDTAMRYRWWAVAVPAAGVAAFVWDGVFIGMGLTRQMLASMAMAAVMFFVAYFLLIAPCGNHGLWLAFIAYLLTRGLMQTILYLRK